ncbi:MAG: P27 family phage terminase small subunit [Planctomycetes bacterium]|nr:P27 family phage terminase small subunit [Planctomycetota bacterium]
MSAPEHLSDAQKAVWLEVEAVAGPCLSESARQLREAYCMERARWLEAEAYLKENGDVLTLRSDKGVVTKVIEAPQLKIAQRSRDAALRLAGRIGLGARKSPTA